VYAQLIDGSLRRAADTVGSELFTKVHKPHEQGWDTRRRRPPERSEGQRYRAKNVRGTSSKPLKNWFAALDDFRNWLILEAA
jgi:hypothetical protein